MYENNAGDDPPAGSEDGPPNYRTEFQILDERRRARHRREAGGASRDLVGSA